MTKARMALAAAAVVLMGVAPVSSQGAEGKPVDLAPHRAIYDVELARSSATAGVAELSGRIVYELRGTSCAGFDQTMRFVTRTINNEGSSALSDMRSEFSENAARDRFEFSTENFRNQKRTEGASGLATRKDDGSLTVEMTTPKRKTLTFGERGVFPISHAQELIAAARAGRKVYATPLFDGAEQGEKIFSTTAIIGASQGRETNADLERADGDDVLNGLEAWPVSMSYFEKDAITGEGTPSYELAFLLFENGVSRRLYIDYGSFAIRATLTRLEMLKRPDCAK